MIVSVDEVLHSEARRQPFAAARCAAKASMLAGESARALADAQLASRWAYSPRGGPPVISGLVPAGGAVRGCGPRPEAVARLEGRQAGRSDSRRDGADRRAVRFRWWSVPSTRPAITIWSPGSGPRSARSWRAARLTRNIPDMMARGWAEFHRDLYTEFRRDGLIMDLRDTQGSDVATWWPRSSPAHHRLERVPVRGAVELPGRFRGVA